MAQQGTDFYSKTPFWRRAIFAALIGILAPPLGLLFLAIPDPSGFVDLEPASETFLFFAVLWGAMSALIFVGGMVMFEFWWKRNPPSWMTMYDDEDTDTDTYEADFHG